MKIRLTIKILMERFGFNKAMASNILKIKASKDKFTKIINEENMPDKN